MADRDRLTPSFDLLWIQFGEGGAAQEFLNPEMLNLSAFGRLACPEANETNWSRLFACVMA